MRLSHGFVRFIVTIVALLPSLMHAQGQSGQKFKTTDKYVPGQVIVRYKEGTMAPAKGASPASAAATDATIKGARVGRSFRKIRNLRVVQLPEGVAVQQALDQLRADPNVLYAEPDYIVHTDEVVPNDSLFGSLWGMKNTGLSGGTVDADIDATDAWTLSTGSNNVIVGTIDTGVDYNHPDLAANIFNNPTDCNTNGIDDDGNGYVDDCHGINPVYGNSNPYDDAGHGTHVAGTIGALGNNGLGVVGMNWHVSIMPCKFLDYTGFGPISAAITCLDYFATMKDLGYNIVATNNSWGGGSYSQALYDAIKENMERGILFIAAAGNGGADGVGDNNDQLPHYPSTYDLQNIIAVAATTRTDAKSSFSNYGRRTVDLGAPGSAILSTLPNAEYGVYDGTSMATPHVTGTAALLKAFDPTLEWYQIRNLILAGGDVKSSMASTFTGKRLNTYGSMNCVNRPVSGRLTPETGSSVSGLGDTVLLSYLNINCKNPAGSVNVTATPGGIIALHDEGSNGDPVAGDGAYSALLSTSVVGTTSVTFPGSDTVTIKTLRQYTAQESASSYRNFTGANLQLSDELARAFTTPFPIRYGGGSFSTIYIGSNGLISFDKAFNSPVNDSLPVGSAGAFIAPWWQDFEPLVNTSHNVFTATLGSSPNRELVVEWRDVPLWNYYGVDLTQTAKFQVVFFEGKSDVLFNYADVYFTDYFQWDNQAYDGTVGVQVGPKSGSLYSRFQQKLTNNSAVLWTVQPDDFELDVPNPVLIAFPGQTVNIQGKVTSFAGFNAPVTLSCANGQLPVSCLQQDVTPNHEGVSVAVPVSDPNINDLTFNLQGNGSGIQRTVPITLKVVDFNLGAPSAPSVTVPHGTSSSEILLTLTALGSFDAPVTMSCAGLPVGASCSFAPSTTLSPTAASPVDLHVTVNTAFSTPLATTTFQIQASAAGAPGPKSVSVNLTTITNTDFSLTPSKTSFTGGMAAGYKGTVLVEAHDGYTGTVTLGCSVVPAGPTCTLDTLSTTTFPVTANVTVGLNGMQADDYRIVITGNDGSHSHTATTVWHVSGFQVSLPALFSIYANATNYVHVQITRINGYTGDLYLSCVAGTINCNGYLPNYSSNSTVSFSSPDAMDPVPTTLTVAESYPGTAKVQINVNVTVKGFTLSYGTISSQTVFPGETPQAYQVTLTPYNGYDLSTSFYCNGYVGQGSCSISPPGPWVPNGGTYTVNVNTTAPLNQTYDGGDYWLYANLYATVPNGVYLSESSRLFGLHVKDFIAGASPFWIYLDQGGSTTATVSPSYSAGFNTPIQVSCAPPPTGITCDVTPGQLSAGQTAVLTLSASQAASTQSNSLYVAATGQLGANSATRQSPFNVVVQTFNAAASPATNTVVTGGTAQYGLSFTSPNGAYYGNINIGCTNLPPGVTCQANPSSVPFSWISSSITVTVTPGVTPSGANTITVTAASAGISRSVPIVLNIQDFALSSANPSAASNPGASSSLVVTTKAFAGFNTAVALSCGSLPAGATCSFSANNFTPTAAGTSTTVTVATTTAVPGGVYPFTINASSQGQTRTLSATLTVKDLHFTSTPVSRNVGTVPAGQTDHTTYALSAIADNGFSSAVTLSCVTPLPTGVTCAFSPSSLTPTAVGAASTLTVTVSSTTPAGSFTLHVKGVSGAITRQLPLTLNTGGPNFTQAVTPASVAAIRGTSGSYTVLYTPLGGMTDPIAVGCSTPAAGMTCSANPDTVVPGTTPGNRSVVTFTASGITPTTNTMVGITGSALGIVRSNTVTLAVRDFSLTSTTAGDLSVNAGASATRSVQLKSLNGLSGSVGLSCNVSGSPAGVTCTVPASAAPTSAGVTVNVTIATTAAAPAGGYLVTVSGTNGGQARQYQFTAQIRDYQIFADDPVSIGAVPTGQTDIVDNFVSLNPLNGFNATVTLTCATPLPTGVTCTFFPASLVPTHFGPSPILQLKVSSTTPNGSYPITVRSTAGSLVKSTTFTLNVGGPNFLAKIAPATAASLLGTPTTYTVTYLVAGGMNTPIDISCQSPSAGIVCTANPTQVTPGVTAGNQSVITVTGTPGTTPLANALIGVMGASVDLNRRRGIGATYTPRDFSLTTATPARTVNAASSISTVVTVKALNGFAGPVTMGCAIEGAPTGMTCSVPVSVNPSASGSGVGVSVMASALTPAGTYTIHVNGSNSGQTRSMTFTVDVRDFSLDISPAAQTIPGTGTGSTTFSLTLTALNGFTSGVSLTCLGPLPVGLTCSFSPSSVVPGGAGTPSTLTVNVTATNTQGAHPVTVRAASGTLIRQQTVTATHGP